MPNLRRREDRWYTCLGALLALDYNPNQIERFNAHDGDNYPSYELARDAAMEQFPDSAYLAHNSKSKHYYCWSWTWYDIITQIANGDHGSRVLLLVDDWAPRYSYPDTCKQLAILNSIYRIKCVQLATTTATPKYYSKEDYFPPGEPIPNTPFRHNINLAGDHANIVSPEGAHEILALANSQPGIGDPNNVVFLVSQSIGSSAGYYCIDKVSIRLLNHNKHINSFEDGRQFDPTL